MLPRQHVRHNLKPPQVEPKMIVSYSRGMKNHRTDFIAKELLKDQEQ
jgi:hypothetical protein